MSPHPGDPAPGVGPLDGLLDVLAERVAAKVLERLNGQLHPAPEPDRWLTAAEVATRLQKSIGFVYRHQRQLAAPPGSPAGARMTTGPARRVSQRGGAGHLGIVGAGRRYPTLRRTLCRAH